jgi:exosortase
MSNATTLNYDRRLAPEKPLLFGLEHSAWMAIGVVAVLMAATFRFNLLRLWGKTNPIDGESEWQHAFVVPLIGLYYLYINRDELLRAHVKPLLAGGFTKARWVSAAALGVFALGMMLIGPKVVPSQAEILRSGSYGLLALAGMVVALNWGLATMIFGLLFFGYGIWPGQNDYFKDLGMVCTLFGVVLTLCGWEVMKVAWFPIVFLICALPWPGLFYSWVAGPLQVLAAKVAVVVLQVAQVPGVFQSGTKINLPSRPLNVAEACAGLKSLMTFTTVAASVAFLSSRPLWQKLLMVSMAVPIAIFCNVMRVSGQGLLDWYVGQEWSENFAHQFVGMVMLIPAFFMILGLGWLLDQIFVEELDEELDRAVSVASGVTKDLVRTATAPAMVPMPMSAAPIPVRAVKARASEAIGRKLEDEGEIPAREPALALQSQTSNGQSNGSQSNGVPVRGSSTATLPPPPPVRPKPPAPAPSAAPLSTSPASITPASPTPASPTPATLPPVSLPPASRRDSSRPAPARRGFVPPGFVPPTPSEAASTQAAGESSNLQSAGSEQRKEQQ